MGVYIFQSKRGPWIKIGHHKVTKTRPNVYYRIARRGFRSCVHPRDLDEHLDEEDFTLVAWYPTLGRRDETLAHRSCSRSFGEFHPLADMTQAKNCLDGRGQPCAVSADDRRRALEWAGKA
jgi:hypothetical protein